MLLVKTRLAVSAIHGIGLFADQDIPRGTQTWKFLAPFDLVVTAEQVANLSEAARWHFLKYSYLDPETGLYTLCGDDARFLNHADEPNIINSPEPGEAMIIDVAARDIACGEELTCDYTTFDDNWQKGIRT